jgi:hypothetical protein
VSLASVVVISRTVPPDYSATGHVTMIPPSNRTAAETVGRVQNPWEELGFRALGQAVIIKLSDQKVLEELVDAGFTDNFTVGMDDRTPLFTVESIGTSPEQAISTTREVMKIIDVEVVARQTQYGVAGGDLITTLALDNGDTIVKITSKATRVLLVAAAVGVLLSAATTIAIDAILRRRARRAVSAEGAAEPVEPVEPVEPIEEIKPLPVKPAKGKAKIVKPNGSEVKAPVVKATNSTNRAPVMVKYIDVESMETISNPDAATEKMPPPEDATIVLPLYGAKRPGRDDKGRRD